MIVLPYLFTLLHLRWEGRHRDERGATAVEWVVITAILVGIALAVGGILFKTIEGKATDINLDTP